MRALSIRQPYAEMMSPRRLCDLRGVKTIEYRSRPTRLIGQRFYIYAAKKWAGVQVKSSEVRGQKSYSDSQAAPLTSDLCPLTSGLPTGVIVGTAKIACCVRENGHYEWHLSDVRRMNKPRKPKRRPQPVWFKPF